MILRVLLCLGLFLATALPAESAQRQRAHGLFSAKFWRNFAPRPPRSIPRAARAPVAPVRSQSQSAITASNNKDFPPAQTLERSGAAGAASSLSSTTPTLSGRDFPSTQTLE
jgi:hypothetical protein